jgi:hypothetical protein
MCSELIRGAEVRLGFREEHPIINLAACNPGIV